MSNGAASGCKGWEMMEREDAVEGQIVWHKTLNERLKVGYIGQNVCWAVRKDSSGEWDHWSREFAVHYSDLEGV